MTNKYWQGSAPLQCDMDQAHTSTRETFVDGATKFGPWGIMCIPCFERFGLGLGTGKGQKYQRQANGSFFKVEG